MDVDEQNTKAGRSIWLIVIGSFLTPFMVVALWFTNTFLNTQNYLAVVGPLSYNPTIATAMTDFFSMRAAQDDRIENAIQNALPENAQILIVPLVNALVEFIQTQIYRIVTSQEFNQFWVEANRVTHQQVTDLLLGKGQALALENGQVVLDVGQGIEAVKTRLGIQGLDIVEQLAPNLKERQVVIAQAPQLASWQRLVTLLQPLAIILPIAIAVLFGIPLWRSYDKRDTLSKIGIGISVAMFFLLLLITLGRNYYINRPFRLPFTPEVAAVLYDAFTQPLLYSAGLLFVLGLFAILAALLNPKKQM